MIPQTPGIEFYERDESGRITATATYVPGEGKDGIKVIVSFRLIYFSPIPPPLHSSLPVAAHTTRKTKTTATTVM